MTSWSHPQLHDVSVQVTQHLAAGAPMAQRRSTSGIIVGVCLVFTGALLACDLAIAILQNSTSLFPGKYASQIAELTYI